MLSRTPSDENNDTTGSSILELTQSTADAGYTGTYTLNGNPIDSLDLNKASNSSGYSASHETTGWLNINVILNTETKKFDITLTRITNGEAADVSEYAVPALQWACGSGVINGYPDGTLAPKASITRAEFAAVIDKIK